MITCRALRLSSSSLPRGLLPRGQRAASFSSSPTASQPGRLRPLRGSLSSLQPWPRAPFHCPHCVAPRTSWWAVAARKAVLRSLLTCARSFATSSPAPPVPPPGSHGPPPPSPPPSSFAADGSPSTSSSVADGSSSSIPSSSDTIPLTSDGNLDAELGEAMASTGADMSTPSHHVSQPSDPSSTLTALEIDDQGRHTERDFSPLQLARRFGLHPRDMRFLDSSLRNLPSLLVRREVIIVNLELFKAIISAREVLLFDPWYPHIQSIVPLMKHALSRFHKATFAKPSESTASAASPASSASPSPPANADNTPLPPSIGAEASPSAPHPPLSAHAPPPAPPLSLSKPVLSIFPSHLPPSAVPAEDDARGGPTVREMAGELESAFRDRSLFGLRDHEREYEEWMEPHMPFEFIALELILMTVTRTLEARFEVYNSSLSPLLSSSSTTLNEGSTLMHLLQLKNGLTSFEVVLEETGVAIKAVLQDDRDMLDMFLTMKARGQVPRIDEHGEIEVLLETYLRKVDELENEVRTNVKSISLTEEHIQIRLDTMRNAMMKVDLLFTICTFAVATSALVASTFGMNLRSHLEQSPYAFYVSSAVMLVLSAVLIQLGLRMCRQHKIGLFHVEPEEPKLRLPINSINKHKRRASPVHRQVKGQKEGGGGEGMAHGAGKEGKEDAGGFYDRDEWYKQTLEWKLQKLEAMREKQDKMMHALRHAHRRERGDR